MLAKSLITQIRFGKSKSSLNQERVTVTVTCSNYCFLSTGVGAEDFPMESRSLSPLRGDGDNALAKTIPLPMLNWKPPKTASKTQVGYPMRLPLVSPVKHTPSTRDLVLEATMPNGFNYKDLASGKRCVVPCFHHSLSEFTR